MGFLDDMYVKAWQTDVSLPCPEEFFPYADGLGPVLRGTGNTEVSCRVFLSSTTSTSPTPPAVLRVWTPVACTHAAALSPPQTLGPGTGGDKGSAVEKAISLIQLRPPG